MRAPLKSEPARSPTTRLRNDSAGRNTFAKPLAPLPGNPSSESSERSQGISVFIRDGHTRARMPCVFFFGIKRIARQREFCPVNNLPSSFRESSESLFPRFAENRDDRNRRFDLDCTHMARENQDQKVVSLTASARAIRKFHFFLSLSFLFFSIRGLDCLGRSAVLAPCYMKTKTPAKAPTARYDDADYDDDDDDRYRAVISPPRGDVTRKKKLATRHRVTRTHGQI